MKPSLFAFFLSLFLFQNILLCSQSTDAAMVKRIYDEVLTNGECYSKLDYLSNKIGARLSGSPQAAAAVEWSKQVMENYNFDNVFLQEVMVPHWVRGQKETARILNAKKLGNKEVNICALGNSVGTGNKGVLGKIIEVQNFEELEKLGKENLEGKIVFFNRPMNPKNYMAFKSYSGAVDQRVSGASEAAKYGAIGAVIRSMTFFQDDIPHTGTLVYEEGISKIPAVAISTNDANLLSKTLKEDKNLNFYFETHCQMLKDKLSYNVIGEIKGSEKPNEFIVVSGHLDSWDIGDGAHDDGAGCVQAIEVLRLFKTLNIKLKRTIRAVMYMNEENGLRGGKEYAKQTIEKNEKHIAALESDSGGFSPRRFRIEGASNKNLKKLSGWEGLFKPYGIHVITKGYAGADISPLKQEKGIPVLIGLLTDTQRYFKYHHTTIDTFDKINKRELELGAGAMASLIYLIDKYGL